MATDVSWRSVLLRTRFSILLGFLVAYLFVVSPLETVGAPGPFGRIVLTGLLLSSVLACVRHPVLTAVSAASVLPVLTLTWVPIDLMGFGAAGPRFGITAVFLCCTLSIILYDVLKSRTVTVDTISGAVAVYLMIGVAFALAYAASFQANPAAFRFPDTTDGDLVTGAGSEDLRLFAYFSMVTMTTLGYGDMVPVGTLVRSLASFQAVLGQMYVAILVARLVAMQLAGHSDDR